MKNCIKCHISKEFKDFHKRTDSTDGLASYCKSCKKKISSIYYQKNKNRLDIKNKEWKNNNWDKHLETCRNWNKRNKPYKNYQTALRRTSKKQSTPSWLSDFDKDYIKFMYITAKELEKLDGIKRHVDHIHPLKGKNSCGLHVPWNLQILTAQENCKKGSKIQKMA